LKSCCVLQDHYDDERYKTVFSQLHTRSAKPRPQRARPRPRLIFWSETSLVLGPTVSDHITQSNTWL